ncbi:MAG: putative sulfate/molybdate transporter [Deltaproteobacteria bacterium]|nr:putative sulfate/molybdate transporter [Deltaproteobacteria bacterium]
MAVRFDKHELAGAFGDIGTDLPLLIAMIAAVPLDAASVCIVFGALQIASGLLYGIPMPVQPLKAMAAIMLTAKLSPGTLAGGGLVVGATMLILAASGALDWLARVVKKEVVRGIQLGLGISLATIALKDYVSRDGARGYALAGAAVVVLLGLSRQKRVPAPLVVMMLGALYALVFQLHDVGTSQLVGLTLPQLVTPSRDELVAGALVLALPQIALSLGNSVIATSQSSRDLFPERPASVRKIGMTYGLMNLIAPWFGGVPVCHGCGGLVGFYGFGARTGGAPIIYGAFYLLLGLVFAPGFDVVVRVFPLPVLGVVLLFESVLLMTFVSDVASDRRALWVTFAVAAAVVGLPNGYFIGLAAGSAIVWLVRRGWLKTPTDTALDA